MKYCFFFYFLTVHSEQMHPCYECNKPLWNESNFLKHNRKKHRAINMIVNRESPAINSDSQPSIGELPSRDCSGETPSSTEQQSQENRSIFDQSPRTTGSAIEISSANNDPVIRSAVDVHSHTHARSDVVSSSTASKKRKRNAISSGTVDPSETEVTNNLQRVNSANVTAIDSTVTSTSNENSKRNRTTSQDTIFILSNSKNQLSEEELNYLGDSGRKFNELERIMPFKNMFNRKSR